ncbi:AEC family transporter [Pumilibacter intestinalis]|uniref:AEC family transporter n=1 Tax=Pumilibacter intestinalis TaxID=2941511 RepID=UPI00204260F6|nr:AEC family transporter [Pumilibacter intestinalis]
MREFTTTLITVGIMLAYAVPGYILIKAKAIKPDSISAFSRVLMYVCQPALTLYSFNKADFSRELGINLLIFFGIITALQLLFIGLFGFIFRKKFDDVKYRVATTATTLSNCSFLGVPILEAIFPDSPNVAAYSMMYFLSMNLLGWTLISAIITRDKKYISAKKMFINPATISIALSLPFFITGFKISSQNGQALGQIENMINILGKMTAPLCMLIMGMRLATIKPKNLFINPLQYFAVAINQIVFPLCALGLLMLLRVNSELTMCMFVMCACPVASVVQNYAEILGEGQDVAANTVLLGTLSSIATLPLLALLI